MNRNLKAACFVGAIICCLIAQRVSFAEITFQDRQGRPLEANAQSFAQYRASQGLSCFLMQNGGRQWKCAGFENAQLMGFSFDRMPLRGRKDDIAADISIEESNRVFVHPTFLSYAILVDPGEYALSGFKIKVARAVSDVGFFTARRSNLLKDGSSLGGHFKVAAGETVYIGNFALDCYKQPLLYGGITPKERLYFKSTLLNIRASTHFSIRIRWLYRLFDTKTLGQCLRIEVIRFWSIGQDCMQSRRELPAK